MARGKQGRGGKRKNGPKRNIQLTKKQRTHYKQFGEEHPAEERDDKPTRLKKFVDEEAPVKQVPPSPEELSSEEEEEEVTAFQALLSTFGKKTKAESDEDEDEEEEEEEEDLDQSDSEDDLDEEEDGEDADIDEDDVDQDRDADVGSGEDEDGKEDFSDGADDDDDDDEDKANDEEKKELIGDDCGYSKEDGEQDSDDGGGNDDDDNETNLKENDPFTKHFENELPDSFAGSLSESSAWTKTEREVSALGRCVCVRPKEAKETVINTKEKSLRKVYVKQVLCKQIDVVNKKHANAELRDGEMLTQLQHNIFSVMNSYQDLCYSDRTFQNGEELRVAYTLHALNHVLKTRDRVLVHNAKIKSKSEEEYRDQGLTRPKVLIIVPFRDSALRIVNILISLLMPKEDLVSRKKRFVGEFSEEEPGIKGVKPEDYEATFSGNTDDCFRIGVGITKKSLKLYTPFYMSDIIIASPLGLRTVIGVEGEQKGDFDFLSSIEVMIFDQMDVFLMQNWDHILHLMTHMNLQPKKSHGVDFSRVRMWSLSGWSRFYRQTLMFGSLSLPEINAVFNKHCHNFAGKLLCVKHISSGSISHIVAQLPQVFHRIPVNKVSDAPDARFEFFKKEILPEYEDKNMSGVLIFIPSYFDFVRIRNLFYKEEQSFQKLCEYTTTRSILRARSFFFHRRAKFLLYTERVHFYRRFLLRGIRHLIFYGLPTYPNLYSEMANLTMDRKRQGRGGAVNLTCDVLYTKYDLQRLAGVVGSERAAQMVSAEKDVHMFTTGDL